jgi:hypothetical protein
MTHHDLIEILKSSLRGGIAIIAVLIAAEIFGPEPVMALALGMAALVVVALMAPQTIFKKE